MVDGEKEGCQVSERGLGECDDVRERAELSH